MSTAKLHARKERYMPVIEPAKRHAARQMIKRLYAWDATTCGERERKTDKAHRFALIRLREIERLLQRRHGCPLLPDDDDGRDSLELVAHHIAHLRGEVESHIVAWAAYWCPWMPHDEAEALAERIAAHPHKFKAATLAWRLRLTEIERDELSITTIRPYGVTDADMAERRRRRDRQYQARRRALKRADNPEPISRVKPWRNEHVSRATWYRRRRETKIVVAVRAAGTNDTTCRVRLSGVPTAAAGA